MTFKEAVELTLKGYKIKRSYWKKGHYIELKDNGFIDENEVVYIIDKYGNDWELYIELWEE